MPKTSEPFWRFPDQTEREERDYGQSKCRVVRACVEGELSVHFTNGFQHTVNDTLLRARRLGEMMFVQMDDSQAKWVWGSTSEGCARVNARVSVRVNARVSARVRAL